MQTSLLSMPRIADKLLGSLIRQYPPSPQLWETRPVPQAIVVLGAGRNSAKEYADPVSSSLEMERLTYAAYLHNQTGAPILLSGNPEMRSVMENIFRVPVQWQESNSITTWENAANSDRLLAAAGIKQAWIVTHAWHMPRTMYAFRNRQVEYLPAPVTYSANPMVPYYIAGWIPQANALARSNIALHEWLGLLWYQQRNS